MTAELIPEQAKHRDLAEDGMLRRTASYVALGTALFLVTLKLWAWLHTGSIALLSSALDAVVDAGASLATLTGVLYAGRPADQHHRWGHGKGEALAALWQGVLLGATAAFLAVDSCLRLGSPPPLSNLGIGIWTTVVSMVAAMGLVVMQTFVVRKTGSTAIAGDRAHYLTDVAVNIAVLAAFGVAALTGWVRADPLFALLISAYMGWSAKSIIMHALAQLLDRELDMARRQQIENAVLACPHVCGIHDLRTRDAGDRVFVEFHLEVDGGISVEAGHAIGDATEEAVEALFPNGVEITAHLEPAGIRDERLDNRIAASSRAA